jgi:hypothetical protein
MIKPVKFKQQNKTLGLNNPNVEELPVFQDDKQIISCWKISFFGRIKLLLTGKIWCSVYAQKFNPMWIDDIYPFKD